MKTMKDLAKLCAEAGLMMSPGSITHPTLFSKFWRDAVARVLTVLPKEQRRLLQNKGITIQLPHEPVTEDAEGLAPAITSSLHVLVEALTEVFQETVMSSQYYDLDVVHKVVLHLDKALVFMYSSTARRLFILHLETLESPIEFLADLERDLEARGFVRDKAAISGLPKWQRPDKTEE